MNIIEDDILIRSLKRISLVNGDVLRAVKASDEGFAGFGEAYFSYVHKDIIKAWKLHKQYTANFICPFGKVKVVLYKEDKPGMLAEGFPQEIVLSEDQNQYQCLTILPGIWYGFKGLNDPSSLIFSLLNGEHSLDEQQSASLEEFPYPWID